MRLRVGAVDPTILPRPGGTKRTTSHVTAQSSPSPVRSVESVCTPRSHPMQTVVRDPRRPNDSLRFSDSSHHDDAAREPLPNTRGRHEPLSQLRRFHRRRRGRVRDYYRQPQPRHSGNTVPHVGDVRRSTSRCSGSAATAPHAESGGHSTIFIGDKLGNRLVPRRAERRANTRQQSSRIHSGARPANDDNLDAHSEQQPQRHRVRRSGIVELVVARRRHSGLRDVGEHDDCQGSRARSRAHVRAGATS